MIDFDPHPPPSYEELVKRGYITPPKFHPIKKSMKKTIPFDIEKAKDGAKVVTEKGQEVLILTYGGRAPLNPIIGTYIDEGYEIVSRWSCHGEGLKPGGVDLLLEVEEAPKGYSVSGDAIVKDGNAIFAVLGPYSDTPDLGDKDALLNRIAAALNQYENKISEVDYEDPLDEVRHLKERLLIANSERDDLKVELDRANDEARKWCAQFNEEVKKREKNDRQINVWMHKYNEAVKEIDLKVEKIKELEQWKKEQMESVDRWHKVSSYTALNMTIGEWGQPVQEVVLNRLKKHSEERALLIDRVNNLAAQLEKYK